MYVLLLCALLTIAFFQFSNRQMPPPIFGIYQNPGKWYYLKVIFMYTILKIRKIKSLLSASSVVATSEASGAGYGIKSRSSDESMDCRQTLSEHPKAIDAVYFNLANKEGWNLVVGSAHRPHSVVDGFVYLRVPGLGLLQSPKLPDTLLFRDEEKESPNSYGAEGIKLTPFMPMRSWRVQYSGKMRLVGGQDERLVQVELDGIWSSSLAMFDFDTDMDALAVAKSMAREPWSREYFKCLQDFHQTHYEQHGDLNGTVAIDGETHRICVAGPRDHSYARRREWKSFHRYGLHFVTLENGARFNVGVVSAPIAFSRIELGYMYTPDGRLLPVQACDLALEQHGENGCPPLDYSFAFKAGGDTYRVQVQVEDSPEFFVGWEWEARVVERLVNVKVNGVAGWGAAEWEYRHVNGRPVHLQENDPPESRTWHTSRHLTIAIQSYRPVTP